MINRKEFYSVNQRKSIMEHPVLTPFTETTSRVEKCGMRTLYTVKLQVCANIHVSDDVPDDHIQDTAIDSIMDYIYGSVRSSICTIRGLLEAGDTHNALQVLKGLEKSLK